MDEKEIDSCHIQVMKGFIEKTENQVDSIMKIYPDFGSEQIPITCKINEMENSELIDIKHTLKHIKYEFF